MECYDCGLEYGGESWIEAIVPDDVWLEISPTGSFGGILCISCIVKRLWQLGYNQDSVPVWICGTEPIYVREKDPMDDGLFLSKRY